MNRSPLLAVFLLLVVLLPAAGWAQAGAVATARDLLARYHEDLGRIDRARDLLEDDLRRERTPEALTLLARAWFEWGDVRARTPEEKLAAYDRGREAGRRAVELAPRSEEARVWYLNNTGRWGQTKGVVRSLFLLPTIREELEAIFALNPRSVRGHLFAGNLFLEVPPLLGGDREKSEHHFKRGLEVDPHLTALRLGLARLYIHTGRHALARPELRRVLDERHPSDLADWTVKVRPRARQLLESLASQ